MDDDELDDQPPEGFVRASRGPFTTRNGPIYVKQDSGNAVQGIRLRERHCNGVGIVHGGMLMTFADGVLGVLVHHHSQTLGVTVRMVSDFLSPARPGEWLEGRGVLTKIEDGFAFCEAELYVGHRDVLKASGVFKLMQKRGK